MTGRDGFTSSAWLKNSGASLSSALIAWERGSLAAVPVGKAWDVVRMPRRIGWRTVTTLRTVGATVGPVLHSEGHVDFLVPVGSVRDWDQDDATVLAAGVVLNVPHPAITAPRTQHARTWIVPPSGSDLTDGDALYEAYAAARASLHMDAVR